MEREELEKLRHWLIKKGRETPMRKSVLVSDITGEEITNPATIRLTIGFTVWKLDVDQSESVVELLKQHGVTEGRRGRKKKTALAVA